VNLSSFLDTDLDLISDRRELEHAHALVKALTARVEVHHHLDHSTSLKVRLEQSGQLVDPVRHLFLVGASFLVGDHRVYAPGKGQQRRVYARRFFRCLASGLGLLAPFQAGQVAKA